MRFYKGLGALAALTVGAAAVGACGGEATDPTPSSVDKSSAREMGSVGMAITLPDDSALSSVKYNITGPGGYSRSGSVPVGDSNVLTFRIGEILVGNGYAVLLDSTTSIGDSCLGSASFNVVNSGTTHVSVLLVCDIQDAVGDPPVGAESQCCPEVTAAGAIPGEAPIGSTIALSAAISRGTTAVRWSGPGGSFADADAYATTFTCTTLGSHTLTVAINSADPACNSTSTVDVVCAAAATCGNRLPELGEECDDGNTVDSDGCTNACRTAVCGDGIELATVEACDDGNTVAADGCENDCSLTPSVGGDVPNQLAACHACRAANCGESYQGLGFDFVGQCFTDSQHAGDPTFIQQCVDLKNCAFANGCGYNANGMTECFCGTVDLGACQVEGAANGPCRPQIFAAARTTVLAEVIGNFGVVALPIGVANYLQQCDVESCAACTP